MPGSTTRHSLPYPVGTDPVGDGDLTAKSLAELIDTKLDITTMSDSVGRRARNLCLYNETVSNGTGYIVIQTPFASNSIIMSRVDIRGMVYEADNASIDISVSFYPFTDNSIYNCEVANTGSFHATVQVLNRNSDGKIAIALLSGTSGQLWNYPKLVVDGIFGHTAMADSALKTGWSISRVPSLTGYTVKSSPLCPRPAAEDTGWLNPTFSNGWTQYDVAGGNWTCQYRRKGGIVHLRGLVIPPATTTSVILYMPVGFRPIKHTLRGVVDAGGTTRQVYSNIDGAIYSSNGSHASWLSLEGMTWPAEQ